MRGCSSLGRGQLFPPRTEAAGCSGSQRLEKGISTLSVSSLSCHSIFVPSAKESSGLAKGPDCPVPLLSHLHVDTTKLSNPKIMPSAPLHGQDHSLLLGLA